MQEFLTCGQCERDDRFGSNRALRASALASGSTHEPARATQAVHHRRCRHRQLQGTGAVRAARRDHQPVADPEGRAAARLRAAARRRRSPRTAAGRSTSIVDQVLVRFGLEILEDRARPRLDRGRCAPELRHRAPRSRARSASSRCTSRPASAASACSSRSPSTWEGIQAAGARARGHPLQPDAAVLVLPGGGLRRGRRAARSRRSSAASTTGTRRPPARVGRGGERRRATIRACSR